MNSGCRRRSCAGIWWRRCVPRPRLCCRRSISTACSTSTSHFSHLFMISVRPAWYFGRVALVGDAASTPRPHLGFGVSKAGAEAQALADALSNYDDIDRALSAYNAVRRPLSERIVLHGRKLGMQLGVGIETD